MRLNKMSRSLLNAADGVVPYGNHPVRSDKEASRHFISLAATPPH